MKAKLIKKDEHYLLEVQPCILSTSQKNTIIANTFDKPKGNILQLSLKNCQAIECGYDLDGLAEECSIEWHGEVMEGSCGIYKVGFKKALEILGDKKFSDEDIKQTLYLKTGFDKDGFSFYKSDEEIIQSLQQTEWDCIVEMEGFVDEEGIYCGERPKLDADGCLILRRK